MSAEGYVVLHWTGRAARRRAWARYLGKSVATFRVTVFRWDFWLAFRPREGIRAVARRVNAAHLRAGESQEWLYGVDLMRRVKAPGGADQPPNSASVDCSLVPSLVALAEHCAAVR